MAKWYIRRHVQRSIIVAVSKHYDAMGLLSVASLRARTVLGHHEGDLLLRDLGDTMT